MNKVETIANPASCLNRAADDEPIFVLRANDPCAPVVVRNWARMYEITKVRENGGSLTDQQLEKLRDALSVATKMDEWQRAKGVRS